MKIKIIFKNLAEAIDCALEQEDSFRIEKIGIRYKLTFFDDKRCDIQQNKGVI
mgnify:CR=1 FL=1